MADSRGQGVNTSMRATASLVRQSGEPAGATVALLLLRLAAGAFLLPHGLGKLFGWFGGPGIAGFAAELQGFGLPSAAPLPLLLALVQTLTGLAVAIGLWTRGSSLAAAAFLAMTVLVGAPSGWFWMHHGIEYPLMWTTLMIAVSLLGPGRASVDHMLAAQHSPHAR